MVSIIWIVLESIEIGFEKCVVVSVYFINKPGTGLFTSQDCSSDKDAAREGVVNYCERAAMQLMQ